MHFFSDYEQGNEQPELINSDRRLCGAVWGPWIHQLTQGDADVGKFTVHVQSDLSGACDWSGGGSRVLRRRCRKAESPNFATIRAILSKHASTFGHVPGCLSLHPSIKKRISPSEHVQGSRSEVEVTELTLNQLWN